MKNQPATKRRRAHEASGEREMSPGRIIDITTRVGVFVVVVVVAGFCGVHVEPPLLEQIVTEEDERLVVVVMARVVVVFVVLVASERCGVAQRSHDSVGLETRKQVDELVAQQRSRRGSSGSQRGARQALGDERARQGTRRAAAATFVGQEQEREEARGETLVGAERRKAQVEVKLDQIVHARGQDAKVGRLDDELAALDQIERQLGEQVVGAAESAHVLAELELEMGVA